jgi:hypothetical protein
MSKLNALLSSKTKYRRSPSGTETTSYNHALFYLVVEVLHLIRIAIHDDMEQVAVQLLTDLSSQAIKKKFPYEANMIFLSAMTRRMEKLCLMILDKGFPIDLNDPIFTMRSNSRYSANIPFRINASLFPSYFHLAVAMGFETLVRFMIKVGYLIQSISKIIISHRFFAFIFSSIFLNLFSWAPMSIRAGMA